MRGKPNEGDRSQGNQTSLENTSGDLASFKCIRCVCVHLSFRQVPMNLEQASAATATYAVPKWLAALTAVVS